MLCWTLCHLIVLVLHFFILITFVHRMGRCWLIDLAYTFSCDRIVQSFFIHLKFLEQYLFDAFYHRTSVNDEWKQNIKGSTLVEIPYMRTHIHLTLFKFIMTNRNINMHKKGQKRDGEWDPIVWKRKSWA